MVENKAVENALGTIGAVLWTIQIIPQLIKTYRMKDTEGLSALLMFVWAVASLFLGVYVIVQDLSIPIIIQPQGFGALSAVSVAQCLRYGQGRSKKLCLAFFFSFIIIMAGFEVGMTYAIRSGMDRGIHWPVTMFGIISAVLLAGALAPQYWEIYRLKEVKGISLTFMLVDMAGGVFCTLSLAFRGSIDIIGAVNYSCVVVLDGGVLLLAALLNPRAKRKRLAAENKDEEADPQVDSTISRGDEPTTGYESKTTNIIQANLVEKKQSNSDRSDGHLQHPDNHHHHLTTVSKEQAEESFEIDPVAAAVQEIGAHGHGHH